MQKYYNAKTHLNEDKRLLTLVTLGRSALVGGNTFSAVDSELVDGDEGEIKVREEPGLLTIALSGRDEISSLDTFVLTSGSRAVGVCSTFSRGLAPGKRAAGLIFSNRDAFSFPEKTINNYFVSVTTTKSVLFDLTI